MTDFTGKQQRNQADLGDGTRETGPTDWVGPVTSMAGEAKSVGAYRYGDQAYNTMFVTPFGTGVSGGEYMNPGGSMWDWDTGLAIDEMPGEWSQEGVKANNSPNANTPSNVIGTVDGSTEWLAGP